MAKVIRIVAKKDGFRRAGVAHSAAPTDHPSDKFDAKQLAALKAEPMLVVSEVEVAEPGAGGEPKPGGEQKQGRERR